MSPKELAPTEDQGVVFGIVDAAANATLDQTSRNAAAANDVFMSMPETQFTFQVTSPSSGFGGMVVAPWGERERSVFDILPEVQHGLNQIPGIRMFAVTPPPLPGGGNFRWSSFWRPPRSRKTFCDLPSSFSLRPSRAACSLFHPASTSK
jgi:multidrug efflux pump